MLADAVTARRFGAGRFATFLAVDFFAILFPPTIGQPMAVENHSNGICTCSTDAMSTSPARRFFAVKFEQNKSEATRIIIFYNFILYFLTNDPVNH